GGRDAEDHAPPNAQPVRPLPAQDARGRHRGHVHRAPQSLTRVERPAMPDPALVRRPAVRFSERGHEGVEDGVAVEGVLEIQVGGSTLSVTLRTPGHDAELALGFMASEGLIRRRGDVVEVVGRAAECTDQPDAIEVTLARDVIVDWARLERRFAATSACGLCGRAHLESLRAGLEPFPAADAFDAHALTALPGRLREAQAAFTATR